MRSQIMMLNDCVCLSLVIVDEITDYDVEWLCVPQPCDSGWDHRLWCWMIVCALQTFPALWWWMRSQIMMLNDCVCLSLVIVDEITDYDVEWLCVPQPCDSGWDHRLWCWMIVCAPASQCIVAVPGGLCNTPYFETFSKGVLVKTTDFKHKEDVLWPFIDMPWQERYGTVHQSSWFHKKHSHYV
jgi:hypothetical protein